MQLLKGLLLVLYVTVLAGSGIVLLRQAWLGWRLRR